MATISAVTPTIRGAGLFGAGSGAHRLLTAAGLCVPALTGVAVALSPIVAAALVLFLLAVVLVAWRPSVGAYALLATLLLVPVTSGIQISESLPVIFPSRAILVVGILGLVINRLASGQPISYPLSLRAPVLLFLTALVLSAAQSVDQRLAFFKVGSVIAEWFATFLLVWNVLPDTRAVHRMTTFLYLITALVCSLAIAEAVTGFSVSRIVSTGYVPTANPSVYDLPLVRAGLTRARSTFEVPIDLGSFLSLVAPLALAIALEQNKAQRRVLAVGVFVLTLIGLALTLSTGPVIGAMTAFLVMLILGSNRGPVTALFAITGITVAVLLLGPAGPILQALFVDRFNFATASGQNVAGRIAIVLAALQVLPAHPLLGSGPGTWFIVNPVAWFGGTTNVAGGAGNENLYASVLVEDGVIGLFCTMWILWRVLSELRRGAGRMRGGARRVLVSGWCAIVGYLVCNLASNELLGSIQVMSMFAVVSALLMRWVNMSRIPADAHTLLPQSARE